MATQCIDVKEDKRFSTTSPIAVGVWLLFFLIINVLVEFGLMYFIVNVIVAVFTHLFFQFEARHIYLSYLFLTKHPRLTPNFEDKRYIQDETKFVNVARVTSEKDLIRKRKKFARIEEAYENNKKYLASLEKGK